MRAGDPTDHYRLLGLDPGATAARIAERLRAEHRSWQRLTSHPDLDRRQLAEQRIRDLALARATLTDPERRAAYDDELARRAAAERAAAEREFAARAAAHREAAHREAAERRAAEHAAADRARAERHLAEQAATTGRPSPPPVPPTPPEAPPGGPPGPAGGPSAGSAGTIVRPRTEPPHPPQPIGRPADHPGAPSAVPADGAGSPASGAAPASSGAGAGPGVTAPPAVLLREARDALAAGDFGTTVRRSREARDAGEDGAEIWQLLGRAELGRGRREQAVLALRQAVRRDPESATGHFWLGRAHLALHDWGAALVAFRETERLSPGEGAFHIALVHLEGGSPEEAVPVLEELLSTRPEDVTVRYHLVHALLRAAQRVPGVRGADDHTVTEPGEIERMRPLLERAAAVVADAGQREDVERDLRYLAWCENRHPARPSWLAPGMLVSAVLLILALLAHPLVFAVVLVVLPFAWYRAIRRPGWWINARAARWDGHTGG